MAPTFAPISLSGTGNKVPRFTIPEAAAAIAMITHKGSANFSVTSVGADGADIDLLVNVIGNYSGTVLFDAQQGQHSVAFKIEADGSWTATIKPVTAARAWDPSTPLTGKGDDVVQVTPAVSGLVSATITHDGSSNFAVTAYTDSPNLLVNEVGAFTGDEIVPDGTVLLRVQADGNWTVTPQ